MQDDFRSPPDTLLRLSLVRRVDDVSDAVDKDGINRRNDGIDPQLVHRDDREDEQRNQEQGRKATKPASRPQADCFCTGTADFFAAAAGAFDFKRVRSDSKPSWRRIFN